MATIVALTGLVLIFFEFFLPGGALAVGGSLLLATACLLYYSDGSQLLPLLLFIGGVGVGLFATIKLALWRVKKGKVPLATDQEGFQACAFPKELIGKSAVASSDLKPSGYISIDNRTYAALSQSGYIDKGSKVHIVDGCGAHLIVSQQENSHV